MVFQHGSKDLKVGDLVEISRFDPDNGNRLVFQSSNCNIMLLSNNYM